MSVVSVSLQKIWDTSTYLANLANKTLSRKRQEVEIEEARLSAIAERAESDQQRQEAMATSKADEAVIAAQQELEVLRRQCSAEVEQARLEADSAVEQASSEGERAVQDVAVGLQRLKNVSDVTLQADAQRKAAETHAEGEGGAVDIVQGTVNDLLEQKARIVAEGGEFGRIALFTQQQLAGLFEAYAEHAKNLELDNVVVMDEGTGINGIVNRGPDAFVDFLRQFEDGFGISVRDLLTATPDGAEGGAS
jgi:hypothetical protein